jgi:hypothetical protein
MTKNRLLNILYIVIACCLYSGTSSARHNSRSSSSDGSIFSSKDSKSKEKPIALASGVIRSEIPTSMKGKIGNNVRNTFFAKINEQNKEAFDLLNQLWHSKTGWQYISTKDGA